MCSHSRDACVRRTARQRRDQRLHPCCTCIVAIPHRCSTVLGSVDQHLDLQRTSFSAHCFVRKAMSKPFCRRQTPELPPPACLAVSAPCCLALPQSGDPSTLTPESCRGIKNVPRWEGSCSQPSEMSEGARTDIAERWVGSPSAAFGMCGLEQIRSVCSVDELGVRQAFPERRARDLGRLTVAHPHKLGI